MFETITSFIEASKTPKTFDVDRFYAVVEKLARFEFGHNGYAFDYQGVLRKHRIDLGVGFMAQVDASNADGMTLLSLVVASTRADHFSSEPTFLEDFVESGLITKWLEALKRLDEKNRNADSDFYNRNYISCLGDFAKSSDNVKSIRFAFYGCYWDWNPKAPDMSVLEIYPGRKACYMHMQGRKVLSKIPFEISKEEDCGDIGFLLGRELESSGYCDATTDISITLKDGRSKVFGHRNILDLDRFAFKVFQIVGEAEENLQLIGEEYHVACVRFIHLSYETYDYLYKKDMDLQVGDRVKVPTKGGDKIVEVVKLKTYDNKDSLPLDFDKYKWVLEKVEPKFRKLTKHVYYRPPEHYSDRPSIGYIVGTKGALLFESGASKHHAQEIQSDLEYLNLPQPKYVAVSHWHWDHSFGLCAWTDATTIASNLTNDELRHLSTLSWKECDIQKRVQEGSEIEFCFQKMKREYAKGTEKIKVVPADLEFKRSKTLDLGDVTVVLSHVGGPHSEDAVVCYIPQDKVLFLGDSSGKDLYGKPWTFDIEHEEDFEKNVAAIPYDTDILKDYLKKLETFDFDTCISGHGEPCPKEQFLKALQDQT
ncbi:MAG: MBL fold metallo-hydrolase [Sphaerochaetaceae bacterium]|nr:MBL fold metallo-hydrolase [Sphaerochaetaceae bacterium]